MSKTSIPLDSLQWVESDQDQWVESDLDQWIPTLIESVKQFVTKDGSYYYNSITKSQWFVTTEQQYEWETDSKLYQFKTDNPFIYSFESDKAIFYFNSAINEYWFETKTSKDKFVSKDKSYDFEPLNKIYKSKTKIKESTIKTKRI